MKRLHLPSPFPLPAPPCRSFIHPPSFPLPFPSQHLPSGFFVEPTILEVQPGMRVWQEEVFGPVLSLLTFDSEEEALQLANDTRCTACP